MEKFKSQEEAEQYRKDNELLTFAEIDSLREMHGLSKEAFSKLLGLEENALFLFEEGNIQEPVSDRLLRLLQDPDIFYVYYEANKKSLSKEERNGIIL